MSYWMGFSFSAASMARSNSSTFSRVSSVATRKSSSSACFASDQLSVRARAATLICDNPAQVESRVASISFPRPHTDCVGPCSCTHAALEVNTPVGRAALGPCEGEEGGAHCQQEPPIVVLNHRFVVLEAARCLYAARRLQRHVGRSWFDAIKGQLNLNTLFSSELNQSSRKSI